MKLSTCGIQITPGSTEDSVATTGKYSSPRMDNTNIIIDNMGHWNTVVIDIIIVIIVVFKLIPGPCKINWRDTGRSTSREQRCRILGRLLLGEGSRVPPLLLNDLGLVSTRERGRAGSIINLQRRLLTGYLFCRVM